MVVDRRCWLWSLPVYLVFGLTLVVVLHSLRPTSLSSSTGLTQQLQPPRSRREASPDGLIDLDNFKFLQVAAEVCSNGSRPKRSWVGVVVSAPDHYQHRERIRNTWAMRQQVVFLLGKANSTYQQLIEREARTFGDIVQGNFLDSYRNLTYKHAMGLLWMQKYCPSADFLLKTDDDVFVHTDNLETYLRRSSSHRLLVCPLIGASLVQRSYRSKWRVSPSEYPGRWYPPYCFGWVVLYSADVARSLFSLAQLEPYFWIDDVHITGTLVEKLNLTHTPLGRLGLSEEETEEMLASGGMPRRDFLFSLTATPANIYKLWSLVNESPSNEL